MATEEKKNVTKQQTYEAYETQKPASYQSQWQPQMTETLDKLLNRKDFAYNVNEDALYDQYKDQYVNGGKMAMMDTMGQAAALTGGYGNSYAQTAGQQAYHGYLQGLNDKIPELYQLALNRYTQQGQDLLDQYSLLGAQDELEYGRYRDSVSDYNAELERLYAQYIDDRNYQYQLGRDAVADQQWQAEFDEDLRRFNFANKLGEFAPAADSGGGGAHYYTPASGSGEDVIDASPVYEKMTSAAETIKNLVSSVRHPLKK